MNAKIFLFLFLCATLFACQTDRRTPFKITGALKNLDGTQVSLEQYGIVFAVTAVKGGTFSLTGNLTSMQMCEIVFRGNGYTDSKGRVMKWGRDVSVFVEGGATYKLIANNEDDLLKNTYQIESTSVHQNCYSNYVNQEQQLRKDIKAKLNELDVKISASLGNDHLYGIYLDSLRMYEDKLQQSRHITYRKLMTENPNSYASIYIASTAYDIPNDLPFYEGLYKRLDKEFKQHDYGKAFKKKLDEAKDVIDK